MKARRLIYAVAAILMLAACGNDSDTAISAPVALTVTGDIVGNSATRISYDSDGSGKGKFVDGDIIYVSKSSTSTTDYVNVEYTYRDGKFETSTPYYIYAQTASVAFTASNVKSVNTEDQTVGLADDVIVADGDASPTSPVAAFHFTHRLSKLTMVFSSKVTECTLSNLQYVEAKVDEQSGVWTHVGNRGNVKFHLTQDDATSTTTAEAFLIAGQDLDVSVALTVVSNGNKFSTSLGGFSMQPGIAYSYKIKILDKMVIEDDLVTINPYNVINANGEYGYIEAEDYDSW
jgi:hypothetical protein